MLRNKFLKSLVAATALSGLLLSSATPAYAVSVLGVSMEEETRFEQLAQIKLATDRLETAMAQLEKIGIAPEVFAHIKQMTKLMGQFHKIMEMDPPFEMTLDHVITLDSVTKFNDEIAKWYVEYLGEVNKLRNEIALDGEQYKVLASAANMIIEPPGTVAALQANTLSDMSAIEQQRRQMALAALDSKVAWVEKKLQAADAMHKEALVRCITQDIGCGE